MPILLNNLMKPSPSLDLMAIKGCGDDDDDDDDDYYYYYRNKKN